ncbi:hypothetical protein VCHA54P500_140105 [Vibrio chagasii]|nr:hypothetical protein VCHA34P117_140010 [Vibrio chagasii]CAH6961135.1 hypothetical protein VCHA40O236_150105 [Vibrio chagasii]CAH6966579.1 hypothetical protein VCHA48P439_160105 [Vibrio chagasii]CAH7001819.1 hypothetical protein VCHA54P500_140105 [Vibrio chagasii]CAH7205326.1 hypothetical protein VCHA53O462_150105 [Vibrio chagasii]
MGGGRSGKTGASGEDLQGLILDNLRPIRSKTEQLHHSELLFFQILHST